MKTRDEKNNHDTVIPPDKGYSNMHGKTWRQIKAENGFQGINFNDGRADFRPVSSLRDNPSFRARSSFAWGDLAGGNGAAGRWKADSEGKVTHLKRDLARKACPFHLFS